MANLQSGQFMRDICAFNTMYRLPLPARPTLEVGQDATERLTHFKKILGEELAEVDAVLEKLRAGASELDVLTELADWLGDIQVYCASEMARFGLPQEAILSTIMQSNFSKLGADGEPIYDGRGKVQKGPEYWRPEPKIRQLLEALCSDNSATCIGCRCDDLHACESDSAGKPCHWLTVDRESGLGVCSECSEYLSRWHAGDRTRTERIIGQWPLP